MSPAPSFDGCQVTATVRTGAVADLYAGVQLSLGRRVFIKALSPSILPSSPFAATLEREAQLLAELDHPNILRIHDFVRKGDRMWLLLEYVDGWSLEELVEQKQRLSPSFLAAVALELARALDHAHQKGIVHRDVRPHNVMVSRQASVKLGHFNVAVNDRLPSLPELLDGTAASERIAFMAPEQILDERPDPRSDLFSLGVTMYRALSGHWPFGDSNEPATQQIRHHSPAPLGRLVESIPGSLERTIHRCLQKVATDRFSSAAELSVALGATLEELGERSPRANIVGGLAETNLANVAPVAEPQPPSTVVRADPRSRAFRAAIVGSSLACAMIVVGGSTIFAVARGSELHAPLRAGSGRLDLVPIGAAHLRVVAEPWAHVVVDGHRVDTTPFARPIPLRAGTHYVRLEHPQAPAERRTIRLVPGETVLLDVKMKVRRSTPPSPDGGDLPPVTGEEDSP
jgi:serine/threonine-protein kinase